MDGRTVFASCNKKGVPSLSHPPLSKLINYHRHVFCKLKKGAIKADGALSTEGSRSPCLDPWISKSSDTRDSVIISSTNYSSVSAFYSCLCHPTIVLYYYTRLYKLFHNILRFVLIIIVTSVLSFWTKSILHSIPLVLFRVYRMFGSRQIVKWQLSITYPWHSARNSTSLLHVVQSSNLPIKINSFCLFRMVLASGVEVSAATQRSEGKRCDVSKALETAQPLRFACKRNRKKTAHNYSFFFLAVRHYQCQSILQETRYSLKGVWDQFKVFTLNFLLKMEKIREFKEKLRRKFNVNTLNWSQTPFKELLLRS